MTKKKTVPKCDRCERDAQYFIDAPRAEHWQRLCEIHYQRWIKTPAAKKYNIAG